MKTLQKQEKRKKLLKETAIVLFIVGISFFLFDLFLIMFNVLPPKYRFGDAELGWAPAMSGKVQYQTCLENATGKKWQFLKNEMGVRTELSVKEMQTTDKIKIAVVGDSHTDLCATNDRTHPGFLRRNLIQRGENVAVLSYGQGKYSPLQSYLLFKYRLKEFRPHVMILNFYTGNDYYDMLRVDDRPHYKKNMAQYDIHPPIWYRYDDPSHTSQSRIVYLINEILRKIGVSQIYTRLKFLFFLTEHRDVSIMSRLYYMNDLRKTLSQNLGYPAAYSAQILNQQLFFYYFTQNIHESMKRVRFLMAMIKEENPDLTLVMSPIPSYQLVGQDPIDDAFINVIERMPFPYEFGVEQEEKFYYQLKEYSEELGWVFVDNLVPLRRYSGEERLYNDYDYHVTPIASKIIGYIEAEALK